MFLHRSGKGPLRDGGVHRPEKNLGRRGMEGCNGEPRIRPQNSLLPPPPGAGIIGGENHRRKEHTMEVVNNKEGRPLEHYLGLYQAGEAAEMSARCGG